MTQTLLSIYRQSHQRYDEMLSSAEEVRPHWQRFFDHLDFLGPEEMRQRLSFVDRSIQDNGITYNVYADPKGLDRPWSLDPLPFIIAPDEWREIATAVAQRATVLNGMLADLYGEQRLIAEGLLPPALVYGQHSYLWPCHGLQPPGQTWLHVYAADLARSPDGRWWVIADRTQSPSGAGYALENRLIVSRVFPDLFRDLGVQHLADFFHKLRESLVGMAPLEGAEQPHIVVLTPGPYTETYFEHAYVARYLGFPLVEGQDLTVRGDTVFLKTLRGLKRVHVILRRVDDTFCDPLEFRGDSTLGVAGLMNAVRSRRVVVANGLGSGFVGSSALMGFLPTVCRRLLGEDLAMPSVATWWCGERSALEYVRQHFDDLVIKPAYPSQRYEPIFGREVVGQRRTALLERIAARPHAYVAQEMVNLSQAPIWSRQHKRRLLPRPLGLRVFAVATPDGYAVMPGGLARVASSAGALAISMQRGGSSKDVWVQTREAVSHFSLLKPVLGVRDLARSGANLSSRVAENLFWLGRYSERFDDTARLLRVALSLFLETGEQTTPALHATVQLAEGLGIVALDEKASSSAAEGRYSIERRLIDAIYDGGRSASLVASIRHLLWAATQVRERLSVDHWHSLNSLPGELQESSGSRPAPAEAIALMDRLLVVSSSLMGFAMDNMTRDDGWRFLIVGRRIERLEFLSGAISRFLGLESAGTDDALEWLLELTDSIITYRSRYSRVPELLPAIDLFVFDDSNPHSVAFQLRALAGYLERMHREIGDMPENGLGDCLSALQSFDLEQLAGLEVAECRRSRHCQALAMLLQNIAVAAREFSDRLSMRYFTHVGDVIRQTMAH